MFQSTKPAVHDITWLSPLDQLASSVPTFQGNTKPLGKVRLLLTTDVVPIGHNSLAHSPSFRTSRYTWVNKLYPQLIQLPPQGPPSRSDWPRSSTKTSSPASAKAAAAAQPEAPPPMMIQSAASGAAAGFAH